MEDKKWSLSDCIDITPAGVEALAGGTTHQAQERGVDLDGLRRADEEEANAG